MATQRTVCVFAHPDDEAFGPGGTIATLAKTQDVYILCATKGDAGGTGTQKDLPDIRSKELQRSASILGVKEVVFLGFHDGALDNNLYHSLADEIQRHLDRLQPETLLTFEPHGVSGHIDHIVISMVIHFLFEKLTYVRKLMLYCHDESQMEVVRKHIATYFVYFPPGYPSSSIDERVDTSSVWDIRKEAIMCHQSQSHDISHVLPIYEELPKEELFLVKTK